MQKRPIFKELRKRLIEPRRFIQVLLGPRQVGKTTLAMQAAEEIQKPYHYISADLATLQDLTWIRQEWGVARQKALSGNGCLLIIDEVQKIPNWSALIKALWDEDTRRRLNVSVVILGSSPWLVQKGLSESLAGRFEVIPITHWSFEEMRTIFHWSLEKYLYFGGYPGAAPFADENDSSRWKQYINESLIETTISRDILLMTQVNKPALLRRLFYLGCAYSGQIFSYSKMVGELQDAGNTTTLAHYLDLLSGAGLLCGLQKYAQQPVRQKNSSPKLSVYNTALMTAQSTKTFQQTREDSALWSRIVESAVGAHLLNAIRGTQMELFYWREENNEVDFVLRCGSELVAIEVKSNRDSLRHSGMDSFAHQFNPSRILLVGEKGISLEEFFSIPIERL